MNERVRDIGEFALIDRLIAALPDSVRGSDTVHGAGDDCAWWLNDSPGTTVATADALVEGVHFCLDWTDWQSLGHKMLAVNLSDIASMGAKPRIAIVTLALTGNEYVADLEALYLGAGELAAIYDVLIVGGDIVRTSGPIMLNVTLLGELPLGEQPMLRSMAKPGDKVLVSGTLGASAAGLELLRRSDRSAATAELLVAAHIRPQPRVSLGHVLRQRGVRCCMDVSDGLEGDLPKILDASGVGATIHANDVPVLPAVRALFPHEWFSLATRGGEDYELLLTAPADLVDDILSAASEVGATLAVIGQIEANGGLLWRSSGDVAELLGANGDDAGAWDHFRS